MALSRGYVVAACAGNAFPLYGEEVDGSTYEWSVTESPVGSTVVFDPIDGSDTEVTVSIDGEYTFQRCRSFDL